MNYVCYRLPEQSRYTYMAQTSGMPEVVGSVGDLGGREGFVIAPFVPSAAHPVLLLRPDVVETREVKPAAEVGDGVLRDEMCADDRETYARDFARFHGELSAGRFDKLVLSRCVRVDATSPVSAEDLFLKACRIYPHQFIALVAMPGAGTWLMATPEVLLEGCGDRWRTMALAGTMRAVEAHRDGEGVRWSAKNMEEQRYVSAYIAHILARYGEEVSARGPYTTAAAHLLHLRTDYAFRLSHRALPGELIDALHPTPAVCGMPKDEARRFIVDHESIDRQYYSGFCGPLSVDSETHLYVSLRCMRIDDGGFDLFAGGGILRDSEMETEWRETRTKLQTMLRLVIQ